MNKNQGKRNRQAGHSFERVIVQLFNQLTTNNKYTNDELKTLSDEQFKLLPKLGTSRRLSNYLDSLGIDIMVENKQREDEFPYIIQAKSSVTNVPYPKLLQRLRETKQLRNMKGIPVVFHQQTRKVNIKFTIQDEFACLYMSDFINMIYEILKLKEQLKENGKTN